MDYEKQELWEELPELSCLREVRPLPKAIYYRGVWDAAIFEQCVTVVGTRRITEYGRRVLEKIIPPLILAGKTIVSGFMYGVDQYAHRIALENGGKTIAVLGWGIANKMTLRDAALAEEIEYHGGLLLSEWERQPATLWTFPSRDRILAALSADTIVIEAAGKSGSLITAREAIKLKRTVWAVPGPITSRTSEGTNKLIADGVAKMWTGDGLGHVANGKEGNPIINALVDEALTANEVARKVKQPVSEVGAQLSLLTLSGEIVEREGKFYIPD